MRRRTFLLTSGTALSGVVGASSAQSAPERLLDAAVRSIAVETDYGIVGDPRHAIRRDGTEVRVRGVAQGTTGCSAVAFSGAVGSARTGEIGLSSVSDATICTDALTRVSYDLALSFDSEPPSDLSVSVSDRAVDPPLVRSASFETGDGDEVGPHHEVEREPALDRATLTGTVGAPDTCTGFQYGGTERDGGRATVVLESFSTGAVCAQAVTPIDYELVLEFPDGLPRTIDVALR